MVKGVSKTIIEVNNTGSKIFEKVVFYVAPEFGNLSAKQLKRAATNFSFEFPKNPTRKGSLKKRAKDKIPAIIIVSLLIATAGLTLFSILL